MDRMPEEVLLRVFTVGCEREIKEIEDASSFCEVDNYRRRRKPFAASVSQVCRWWYNIVNSRRAKHLWISCVVLNPGLGNNDNQQLITRWKETLESSRMEECDVDVYIRMHPYSSIGAWQVVSQEVLHAIAMLVPFSRQLRSLVTESSISEVIGLIISVVSITGATSRMDNVVLNPDPEMRYTCSPINPVLPSVYIGTDPNRFAPSFRGEGLKRVVLNHGRFPQDLALSPYLQALSCRATATPGIEWKQIERLLQPLQVLRKLNLDLHSVNHPLPSAKGDLGSFILPKLTDLTLHGDYQRSLTFLNFLRSSTVTTLEIVLRNFDDGQGAIFASPILLHSLTVLKIHSNFINPIRGFLFSICAPSLTAFNLSYSCFARLKIERDIFSSHTLFHNPFVLSPRVCTRYCRVSLFHLLLPLLNFQGVESLSITLRNEDTQTYDIPSEDSRSKVSNLRFLNIESSDEPWPSSADQFFRAASLRPDTELKIEWGILIRTDPQILKHASVFKIRSLQLSAWPFTPCNKDILYNFRSLTKLVISLGFSTWTSKWLKRLILSTSEDSNCSAVPLILPLLEDLECILPFYNPCDEHHFRDIWLYMKQITESRRTHVIPLRRAILLDASSGELNF